MGDGRSHLLDYKTTKCNIAQDCSSNKQCREYVIYIIHSEWTSVQDIRDMMQ
jgi:hypothetical protein